MSERVLVGMSGGVDSSVATWLLMQQGFEVMGATMRLFDKQAYGMEEVLVDGVPRDIADAKKVAERMGIQHCVLDYQEEFKNRVLDPFCQCYEQGMTPNPCIRCNRYLKFAGMLRAAEANGCNYVATGHYARRTRCGDRWLLQKSTDRDKDQSYFLYNMNQHFLSHFQLPLGDLTKKEVREIAEEQHFVTARKKDSQDICFVPGGDYVSFMQKHTGLVSNNGNYVNQNGEVVGEHKGHIHYTIGQRKGLELAMGHRVYVTGKDVERNLVYIGENEDLFASALEAADLNFIACDGLAAPIRCTAKIRHSRYEADCTAEQIGENTLSVRFDKPQRAISPGQAVVLYDGDTVIGGGTITRAISNP